MYKKIFFFLLFVVVLTIGVTYYLGQNTTKKPENLEDITLKLKWVHQAQFAGNYVAQERGFYANQGLNVKLEPFSFESPTIEAVVAGDADFGIISAQELVLAREKGSLVKAVAVIFKISPDCAYALKESGIKKPQDLVDKTIGIQKNASGKNFYYLMMNKLGVDVDKSKEVDIKYGADELISGEVDAAVGYIINEPHQAVEAGLEVNTILFADYGFNMYADVLFTTDETANNNSQLVQKFVTATVEGWEYAVEHKQETLNDVMLYAKDSTRSHQEYMLKQAIPLIHTGNGRIGEMEHAEWENVKKILTEEGDLSKKFNINEAYTLDFCHIDR